MTLLEHKGEIQELRQRLEDAEETLRAIRSGEVDALVVEGINGEQIFTLQGADHPYRALIEAMQQGAMSLSDDGTVLYCNRCLSQMIGMSHEKVIGITVTDLVPQLHRSRFEVLLKQRERGKARVNWNSRRAVTHCFPCSSRSLRCLFQAWMHCAWW